MNYKDYISSSNAEKELGNHEAALSFAEQALALARQDTDTAPIAASLLVVGICYNMLSQHSRALEYLHQSLLLLADLDSKEELAMNHFYLGRAYDSLASSDEALAHYDQSLSLFRELGNQENIAKNLSNIGIVYLDKCDYPSALQWLEQALALNKLLNRKQGIALTLGNIGNVYSGLSDYARTLEYNQQALAIYEEIGSKSGVVNKLSSIGLAYGNLGDFPRELEYLQKSFTKAKEQNDIFRIACLSNAIGVSYRNLSEYSLAIEHTMQAIANFEVLQIDHWLARCYGNLGNIYQTMNDYQTALKFYFKALAFYEKNEGKDHLSINLGNIAAIYATEEFEGYLPEKAEEFALKAITISEEVGFKHHQYVMYQLLAKLYERQNDWERAYKEFMKSYTLEKEVQSADVKQQAELLEHRRKIEESERDRQVKLARFQEQEKILHNILPSQIADRMIDGEKTIADSHEHVSVFFSDIVGFTKLSQRVSAEELVGMLNGIFTQFDQLARKHGLEKIKTIGDAYMAVCGAPIAAQNHAERTALFALDVAELMDNYQTNTGDKVMIRIGLHSGSVVAGIIGENKFAYDMWGDAVNTASRMESHGEAGKIHISEAFMRALSSSSLVSLTSFQFQERGKMAIKGKGIMTTYFLEKL